MITRPAFGQYVQKCIRRGDPDAAEYVNASTKKGVGQQANGGTDNHDAGGGPAQGEQVFERAVHQRGTPDQHDIGRRHDLAGLIGGPEYGLAVLNNAPPEALLLALTILSPAGQKVLADHGFHPVALPAE
ncbi:MAG TPA: hypothetical protein VGL95_12565 [Acetobacteraceae bacterium]